MANLTEDDMNAQRRKAITDLTERLRALQTDLQALSARLADSVTDVEDIQGDEQEAFDNMPESLQGGDKGQDAQTAIDTLEQAKDAVQEVLDLVEADKLQEAVDALAEAAGQ